MAKAQKRQKTLVTEIFLCVKKGLLFDFKLKIGRWRQLSSAFPPSVRLYRCTYDVCVIATVWLNTDPLPPFGKLALLTLTRTERPWGWATNSPLSLEGSHNMFKSPKPLLGIYSFLKLLFHMYIYCIVCTLYICKLLTGLYFMCPIALLLLRLAPQLCSWPTTSFNQAVNSNKFLKIQSD